MIRFSVLFFFVGCALVGFLEEQFSAEDEVHCEAPIDEVVNEQDQEQRRCQNAEGWRVHGD